MNLKCYFLILFVIASYANTLYANDLLDTIYKNKTARTYQSPSSEAGLLDTIYKTNTNTKGIPITELFESPITTNATLTLPQNQTLTRQSVFNEAVMTASVFWPLISVDEATFTIRFAPQIEIFMLQVTPWETSPYQGKITVTHKEENIIVSVTMFAKSRYRDEADSFLGYLKKHLYPKGPTVRISPSGNMELEFSK